MTQSNETKKKLSINFAQETQEKVVPIPAAPQSKTEGIIEQDTVQQRESFVCYDLLDEDSLNEARRVAASLYPQMYNDSGFMMSFGEEAVDAMNALVDRKQRDEKAVNIPELYRLMTEASKVMRGLQERYDLSQPEVREEISDAIKGEPRGFLASLRGKSTTKLQSLRLDLESVEQQVDSMDAQMLSEQTKLLDNISLQHELYVATEDEILGLVRVIALMELVRELAQKEVDSIKVDASDISQRNLVERRRALVDFLNLLSTKITEYMNRMFIAWASSREIMNDRTLYVGLAMRLQHQMKLTVPAMKLAMLRWAKQIEALQATKVTDVASETANEWYKHAAKASEEAVKLIGVSAYAPTIKEETIDEVSEAVAREAEALFQAYEIAGEQRAGVSNALVKAQRLMQTKDEEINELVIQDLVDQARNRISSVEETLPEEQAEEERHERLSN